MELLAVYALFDIHTSKHNGLKEEAKRWCLSSHTSYPPVPFQSYFGVFVTLYRQPPSTLADQVPRMADLSLNLAKIASAKQASIHGCMGHWSDKALAPSDIIDALQQLVRDARTKDDRRLQFPTDIDQDASATMEINLMNLPRTEMKPTQYHTFNNNTHGIIVESIDGRRATFLPHVFPAAGWHEIKHQLLHKAGISHDSEPRPRFYTYTTTTITVPIYDILFSRMARSHMEDDVATFIRSSYNEFVPYMHDSTTRVTSVDPSEAVRNIAVICDIIRLARYHPDLLDKPIVANLDYYYQKWCEDPGKYRQASIFLIQAYNLLHMHPVRVETMSLIIYSALETGRLEPVFEVGEAVSVLAQSPTARRTPLRLAVDRMLQHIIPMRQADSIRLETGFELNWLSQCLFRLAKLSRVQLQDRAQQSDPALLILRVLMKIVPANTSIDTLDTNYLAVIYECFSNLDALMCHIYLSVQSASFHTEIRNQRLRYFAAASRRRATPGLYYSKGGQVARIAITGHILSAP